MCGAGSIGSLFDEAVIKVYIFIYLGYTAVLASFFHDAPLKALQSCSFQLLSLTGYIETNLLNPYGPNWNVNLLFVSQDGIWTGGHM